MPNRADPDFESRPPLILDVMLGKLARYLRMCGYDAAYALDRGVEADDRVLELAADENRLLLTRDRQLADSGRDTLLLRTRDVDDQLRELLAAGFDLSVGDEPAHCGRCNGSLEPVDGDGDGDGDAGVDNHRPEYAPDDGPVWRCRDCGQFFWKGSHWDDVARRLRDLKNDSS